MNQKFYQQENCADAAGCKYDSYFTKGTLLLESALFLSGHIWTVVM